MSSLLPLSPFPSAADPAPQCTTSPGQANFLKPPPFGRWAQVRICILMQHAASPTLQENHTRRCRLVLACRPASRFQRNTKCVKPPIRPRNILPHALFAMAGRCTEADKAALARGAITLPTRENCAFPLSRTGLTWTRAFYAPRRDRQPAGSLRQAYVQ